MCHCCMNFWPTFTSRGRVKLKCSECGALSQKIFHYLLDEASYMLPYNDAGWLLCESCVQRVGPSKKKAVFDFVRNIEDRPASDLNFWHHCLPFPCDKPFNVIRSDKSITANCTLFANNAYYSHALKEWMIVADLGSDATKMITVDDWGVANPDLISPETRFFMSSCLKHGK